jgi:hypothetical protein
MRNSEACAMPEGLKMKKIVALSLLCGWCLISRMPKQPDDTPFREWAVHGAYDTALDCENKKEIIATIAIKANKEQLWADGFAVAAAFRWTG